MHVRHYESPLSDDAAEPVRAHGRRRPLRGVAGRDLPTLRLLFYGEQSALTLDGSRVRNGYLEEQSRGYEHEGTLWSPGYFHVDLGEEPASRRRDARRVDRIVGDREALTPDAALPTETARRERLLEQAPERLRSGICAPNWCSRRISFS